MKTFPRVNDGGFSCIRKVSPKVLGDSTLLPQGTFGSVWRHFGLSEWGRGGIVIQWEKPGALLNILWGTEQTSIPSKSYLAPNVNSTRNETWLPGRHHSHPQFMKRKLRQRGRKQLSKDTLLVNDRAGIRTQVCLTLKPTLTTPAHTLPFHPLLERVDTFSQNVFSTEA